jgi:hypothetical protein
MSVSPRAPGWYRDPADRSRMRHWSGAYWDIRSRRVPPWMAGTAAVAASAHAGHGAEGPRLDGPVHPAMLPANVKSAAQAQITRRAPARVTAVGVASSPAGSRRTPVSGHPGVPIGRRHWGDRAPLVVGGTLVLAILLAVAGMVAVSKSPITATRVSTDPVFIRSANRACNQAMGAVRTPTGARDASVPDPAVTAKTNRALYVLVAKLQSLRSASALGPQLVGWFDNWDDFAKDRAAEAATVTDRSSPAMAVSTKKAQAAAKRAAHDADVFALDNSLGECVLTAPPTGTSIVN